MITFAEMGSVRISGKLANTQGETHISEEPRQHLSRNVLLFRIPRYSMNV
jgi:hypothetical protein